VATNPSIYGAQDSTVPVRNGGMPDAPDGEHSTQAGTLIEGAAGAPGALPEDPPAEVGDGEVERAVLVALGSAVEALAVDIVGPVDTGPVDTGPVDTGPVDTGPVDTGPVDTAPAPIVATGDAADVDGTAPAGLAVVVDDVGLGAPMPRLTMPLTVTVPGVAVV
jgi:hypothetical protein